MITEEIKAKAKEFAINALQGQIDAIADAYIKGYEEAMRIITEPVIDDSGLPFRSMALPSGTEWMDTVVRMGGNKLHNVPRTFSFWDAITYHSPTVHLPSVEDFEELFRECEYINRGYFLARNGNRIECGIDSDFYVWVRSNIVKNKALAYKFKGNNAPELVRVFTGEKLFVLAIKKEK